MPKGVRQALVDIYNEAEAENKTKSGTPATFTAPVTNQRHSSTYPMSYPVSYTHLTLPTILLV